MRSRRTGLVFGAVAALALAATLVVVLLNQGSSPQGPGTGAVTPTPTAFRPIPSGSLKPEISGLLDRAQIPPQALWTVVPGFVVGARWSDLQLTPGGPITPNNAIDQALSEVRAANTSTPGLQMALKLRIYTGVYSPDWAKQLGGPPVDVYAKKGNVSGTVGYFWSNEFGLAYQDLMTKLAQKYDGVPEIRDVTMSRCMTVFAEPFIRDVSDPQTVLNLLAAGFTSAQDMTCETSQIDESRAWKRTHLSLSFNPYQEISSAGTARNDETFTEQVMQRCRATLGPQCVLENNSIRSPNLPQYQAMYDAMQQLGPPIAFQTAVAHKINSTLAKTIEWAISVGASSVELPAGYQSLLSPDQLASYTQQLRSNRQS